MLTKGREQEAIDVLHRIAKFNKAPLPTLTVEHFAELERLEEGYTNDSVSIVGRQTHPPGFMASLKSVLKGALGSITNLKGLFTNKLQCLIFILLAITYGEFWQYRP
jgi:hypothetical protein